MFVRPSRRAVALALGTFLAALGACTQPRPGPNMNEIFAGSIMREGNAYIVAVGDRVNRAANVPMALGFSDSLRQARLLGGDTIRTGDTVVPAEGLGQGAYLTDLADARALAPTGEVSVRLEKDGDVLGMTGPTNSRVQALIASARRRACSSSWG